MKLTVVSERMFWVEDFGSISPGRFAAHLNANLMPGVDEVVAGFDRIGVFGERSRDVVAWLESEAVRAESIVDVGRLHTVPVLYDGEDLPAIAAAVQLSEEEVIAAHCGAVYECMTLGFQPGFPYLVGLPPVLCGLPRRPNPRLKVPAGSVGITRDQTGIYPAESPGGWNLLGRTPVVICDEASQFFPIRPGDQIRFRAISAEEFEDLRGKRL